MVDTVDIDQRWFKRFGRRNGSAGIRLLCFHHAGGNAAAYRAWARLLPPVVELVAVQLPGRADRFVEPPFDRMEPLVDELVSVLKPLLDRPFACYGTSMGSRVAWRLSHALRERGMPMPHLLYLAGDVAPVHDDGSWPWEGRADGLEGYLREMGGTPPQMLAEPEWVQTMLPTLRADLHVLSTHGFRPATPLAVRIRAFAGTDDPTAPPALMEGWRHETTARFDLHAVRGGHFFDQAAQRQVVNTISNDLA